MKFFLAAVLMLCRISMASAENLLIVGEDEIRRAIEKEFVEQGQNQALDVEFFGGQTVFHIENAQKAKILVSGLKTDELQNRFRAMRKFLPMASPMPGRTLPAAIFC